MPIQCTCLTCGAVFTTKAAQVKKGKGKFCSQRCGAIGRRPPVAPVIQDDGTAHIPLHARNGSVRAYAVVDAADAEWAGQWRWSFVGLGYVGRTDPSDEHRGPIWLHREILGLPRVLDGRVGDHIDRDKLNCRRSNLRIVTRSGNTQNQPGRAGTSQYRGVSWSTARGKWVAQLRINGQKRYFGLYDSETEAAEVARAARARLMPYAVD